MSLNKDNTYFFCGIGGSGMMPLALILLKSGYNVAGSDRGYDQGNSQDKFQKLKEQGVLIFPQNGSGITADSVLIVSSAIEDSIPDVKKAKELDVNILKRANLLLELFSLSDCSIGVSGTSGKTTVTGMIATILDDLDFNPTVMNGGRVKNLEKDSGVQTGNLLVGDGKYFVSEMDESDGSIELFSPHIAVLNNIELDHTSMDQLNIYFQGFINRAKSGCVLNIDNDNVAALIHPNTAITYGIDNKAADLCAYDMNPMVDGINFHIDNKIVRLRVPGRHNVSNALAALATLKCLGVELDLSIPALEKFTGIKRRLEIIGCTPQNITVIDDFGHNPDKIAASLETLKEFTGRLVVMFQPHGFAPLRMMGKEMAEVFGQYLDTNDILCIPEVFYAGGTVDRSVTGKDFVEMIKAYGTNVHYFNDRTEITPFIKDKMIPGDRIVVMGARDDTLTDFAKDFI